MITKTEEDLSLSFEEIQTYLSTLEKFQGISNYKFFKENVEQKTSFLDSLYENKRIPFSLRLRCILDGVWDIDSVPMCEVCGDNKVRFLKQELKFSSSCSDECSHVLSHEGSKKKFMAEHGVEYPLQVKENMDKTQQTNLDRYGVPHQQQIPEVSTQTRATCFRRYGGPAPMSSNAIKEKAIKKNQEKRGVDWFFQSEEFKRASEESNIKKYGDTTHQRRHYTEEAKEMLYDKDILEEHYKEIGAYRIASSLGVDKKTVYKHLRDHGIEFERRGNCSFNERELREFIDSLNVEYEVSNRSVLDGRELDIYIPEKDVAIEFNGVYWHSTNFVKRNYHQEKSLECIDHGIQLIHIWEDDWNDPIKKEIIKNKIKSKLGLVEDRVYARKCEVVTPSTKETRDLYDRNHIQGFTGASVHIGLKHGGQLVGCMSFMDKKNGNWELNRFATTCSVVGGFSKLLKYFKRNFDWDTIVTYAHMDYSHGGVYEKNGFDMVHITPPSLFYVKCGKRLRREGFMKHKLKDKLEDFNPSLTERENMENHGFVQLFDSGMIRYEAVR